MKAKKSKTLTNCTICTKSFANVGIIGLVNGQTWCRRMCHFVQPIGIIGLLHWPIRRGDLWLNTRHWRSLLHSLLGGHICTEDLLKYLCFYCPLFPLLSSCKYCKMFFSVIMVAKTGFFSGATVCICWTVGFYIAVWD